jgi:diguanylate cyclase (GGDEF)-like protein
MMDQSEDLANLLAGFAHTLGSDFSIQKILDHLVQEIAEVLSVTGAGVMLMGDHDELHFAAASNATILEIERLQNELAEGPCLRAYQSGEAVMVPDLAVDTTFPAFSVRALAAGLCAVFTFPISLNGKRLGALDLYNDRAGALSQHHITWAQVLADVAAAYIRNAQRRSESEDTVDLLRQRSLHDSLTGLPNRTLLKERLEQAVVRSRRSHQVVAVLFVDIDRFKAVNDTFGHHIGDRLLTAVSERLARVVRAGDTLARLSGDEFVIMCEGLGEVAVAEHVAKRVVAVLAPPFELEGHDVQISASVGLAFCGPGEELPETLLRDADFAMYEAKRAGGAQHHMVDRQARPRIEDRGQLSQELNGALDRNEFTVVYQPMVAVSDGRLAAVEALLRWRHPRRGLVLPGEILPIAEPTGLILRLGEWVLTQACLDLARWQERFGAAIPQVTVNVSPYQVMAAGFDATVRRVLETTGTDPSLVCLEVTESAFLEDGPRALGVLERTRELGVGLILDDFGSGYSSLNYLRRFPFDMLKIDQEFVSSLATEPNARVIVAAIVDLAHGLDLTVVTEGIETEEQLDAVIDLGTDLAQGYYLCRPLFIEQVERRILEPASRGGVILPRPSRPGEVETAATTGQLPVL